ncbi:hypothetical protein MJM43_29170, partial [Salmonella enterica subsp. enterica serovar Montevideo]|nr:hypothetical protein [Salmonella enterica subsp. enterica serovar Montevideo]
DDYVTKPFHIEEVMARMQALMRRNSGLASQVINIPPFQVDLSLRGSRFYQTLMLLPYAVAPAVAAVLWIFLFNPGRGLITHFLG